VKTLEPWGEHVLGHHEPPLWRQHESLGANRANRRIPLMAREQRNGWNELAHQRQNRVDIERQLLAFDDAKDIGQPPAGDVARHQEQGVFAGAIEPPRPGVQRVAHAGQPGDPFTDRRGKLGRLDEVRTEGENLNRLGRFRIDPEPPRA
jgi:hypothetical protein